MFLLNLMAEKRKKPERGRPCGFPGNAKRDGTAPAFIGISVSPQPCHGMNGLPPRRSLPHLPALFFPLTGAGNIPALRRNPPAACEPDAFSSTAKPSARRAPPGFPFLSGSEEKRTPHKTCRKGRETPAVHLRSIFDSARVFRQQQCHALFFPAYRTCHMWLKRKLPYCGNPTFSMPKAINEKTPCDFSQGVDLFMASPGG